MEIRQLKHFLAIAESGSFTRGAEKAHLSQPAISASIAKLEDELKKPLFIRNKKQATLTPEGKRLRKSAQVILDEYKQVKRSFSDNVSTTTLNLSVASNFPVPKLSAILSDLTKQADDLSFSITDTSPDKMTTTLKKGDFDLAFTVTYAGEALPLDCKVIHLEEECYGVAVPKGHSFAELKSIDLHDIAREPFIEITKWEYRNTVIERLREAPIKLNVKHRTDQYARALSLVAMGLGITIVPSGLSGEDVVFVPFSDSAMTRFLTVFITANAEALLGNSIDFKSIAMG